MKICPKLFNELNFEAASLNPCCNTRALKIPNYEFHGGKIDMAAYAAYIQRIAGQIQENGPICRGCPELIDTAGSGAFRMLFGAISINMHRHYCNCKCVYCGLWNKKDKKPPYEVLTPLKSLQESGALDEKCVISWGGGEPVILPEFNKAAEWAASGAFWQQVHSNAIIFSPQLAAILKLGLGRINISLDSSSRKTYALIKGVDKYEAVLANIEKYCRFGGPENVQLKYIIFDQNNSISEISGFLSLCSSLGIKDVQFSFDFREINAKTLSQKSLLAAAFMRQKGAAMGLGVSPFYVDQEMLAKTEALRNSL